MLVISKLCLFFSCLFLVSCGLWEDWNNNPVTTTASSITPPSQWIRLRNSTLATYNLNNRYNQYTYVYNMIGHTSCYISCGPRSFLTVNSNGLKVCRRDPSTYYWNSPQLADMP